MTLTLKNREPYIFVRFAVFSSTALQFFEKYDTIDLRRRNKVREKGQGGTRMKKFFVLFGSMVLSCTIAVCAAGCFDFGHMWPNYPLEEIPAIVRDIAQKEYEITFSDDWIAVYRNIHIGGMHDDGTAYFVLESEPRDEAFFNTCFAEKNEKFEEKFNALLDGFESMVNDPIEAEYRPNFEEEYVWRLVGRDIVFGEHAQEGIFEVAENPGEWMEENFSSSFWVAYFIDDNRVCLIENRL